MPAPVFETVPLTLPPDIVILSIFVFETFPLITALPEIFNVPPALLPLPSTISPLNSPPDISISPELDEPPIVLIASVPSPPVNVPPLMVNLPASIVSLR